MNKSCRNVLEHLEFKNSIGNVLMLEMKTNSSSKLAKEDEEFVFVSCCKTLIIPSMTTLALVRVLKTLTKDGVIDFMP